MEKLVAELADAPYRAIVSKGGPQHGEFELAGTIAGLQGSWIVRRWPCA